MATVVPFPGLVLLLGAFLEVVLNEFRMKADQTSDYAHDAPRTYVQAPHPKIFPIIMFHE